jgi:hypothetical protein
LHNFSWGIGKLCHLLIHRNALNLCQNQIIMRRKTKLRFKKKSNWIFQLLFSKSHTHEVSACLVQEVQWKVIRS